MPSCIVPFTERNKYSKQNKILWRRDCLYAVLILIQLDDSSLYQWEWWGNEKCATFFIWWIISSTDVGQATPFLTASFMSFSFHFAWSKFKRRIIPNLNELDERYFILGTKKMENFLECLHGHEEIDRPPTLSLNLSLSRRYIPHQSGNRLEIVLTGSLIYFYRNPRMWERAWWGSPHHFLMRHLEWKTWLNHEDRQTSLFYQIKTVLYHLASSMEDDDVVGRVDGVETLSRSSKIQRLEQSSCQSTESSSVVLSKFASCCKLWLDTQINWRIHPLST